MRQNRPDKMQSILTKIVSCSLILVLSLVVASARDVHNVSAGEAVQIPAFPGAEGHGALSQGGRGGRVIEVTNLDNSGKGSLRDCMEATGPRICVFRVAGYIELLTSIKVLDGRLTVAGQTAPGDGITIRRHPSKLVTSSGCNAMTLISVGSYGMDPPEDVIIRYIRVRQGAPEKGPGCGPEQDSGINIRVLGVRRFIVDHVSAGWANDNQISLHLSGARARQIEDVTLQRNLIHEPMIGHNTGIAIAGSGSDKTDPPKFKSLKRIDVHHNLLHSVGYRNPIIKTDSGRVINNLVYNYGSRLTMTSGESRTDVIGNYWRTGPNGLGKMNTIKEDAKRGWPPSIYTEGNVIDETSGKRSVAWDAWRFRDAAGTYSSLSQSQINEVERKNPLPEAPIAVNIQSADNAYASILDDVGMNRRLDCNGEWVWVQDAVDARLIDEVKQRTGFKGEKKNIDQAGSWPVLSKGTPCADSDHDGMADEWENIHGFNPNIKDGNGDADGDGYTNLEEFLNGTSPVSLPISRNVAPTVNVDPDRLVINGYTLSISGSFVDPDPDVWTGGVDYGDGSGIQSLALVGSGFNLSHLYAQDGTYTVTITVSDDKGASGSDTLEIWVLSSGPFFQSRDLDSDGLTEDINGNGRFDSADLVVLFLALDSSDVQDHKSYFDFNSDGAVDFSDLEFMFSQLYRQSG